MLRSSIYNISLASTFFSAALTYTPSRKLELKNILYACAKHAKIEETVFCP